MFDCPCSTAALAAGVPNVIVGGLESPRKEGESDPVAVCAVAVWGPSRLTVTGPVYGCGMPSIDSVTVPGAGGAPSTFTATLALPSNQPLCGAGAEVSTSTPPVAAGAGGTSL